MKPLLFSDGCNEREPNPEGEDGKPCNGFLPWPPGDRVNVHQDNNSRKLTGTPIQHAILNRKENRQAGRTHPPLAGGKKGYQGPLEPDAFRGAAEQCSYPRIRATVQRAIATRLRRGREA